MSTEPNFHPASNEPPSERRGLAGEHERLGEVVRCITASQSVLYAYVCSLLGTSSGAADVLQEANLVLWEKALEYDPNRPFMPWAYKIAYFQVLAYRKRRSRDRLHFDDELLGRIGAAFEKRNEALDDQLAALGGCIEKLAPRRRAVVDARYREGKSVEAIAAQAGRAPNAVSAELYRVRKTLMECVRAAIADSGAGGTS